MMWRPWRVCSGQSCGDGANGGGSGSCVERGVCGASGGCRVWSGYCVGVDREECVDDVETVETVETV